MKKAPQRQAACELLVIDVQRVARMPVGADDALIVFDREQYRPAIPINSSIGARLRLSSCAVRIDGACRLLCAMW
jgi:hypothetical protein